MDTENALAALKRSSGVILRIFFFFVFKSRVFKLFKNKKKEKKKSGYVKKEWISITPAGTLRPSVVK